VDDNPRLLSDLPLVVVVARAAVYGLCLGLAIIDGTVDARPELLLALLLVAVLASLPVKVHWLAWWRPVLEAVAATWLIAGSGPLEPSLLPYLAAPALEAGLLGGVMLVVLVTGLSSAVFVVAAVRHETPEDVRGYISYVAQWVVLALCLGLLAAWLRRVRDNQVAASSSSYASAYRLLSQLRVVSRQLSGGLDPVSLSQGLLQGLRQGVFFSRAAVYVRSEGGRLVPMAFAGVERADWTPALDDDSAWADAWTSGEAQRRNGTFTAGAGGYSAVLPLRVGVRTIGLVGMERTEAPFSEGQLTEGSELVAEASLRLETALLFSEVRSIATAEERRRLAREIHDGIAQELASLGYAVDDLSYRATEDSQREQLQELRHELTRIISELRLSIFDLRSEVQPTMGLGAALSDYARQVGATSPLTVHLVLDESPSRLRADTEAELLRIAQEAITNVRKHARARNLWVTCRIAPPAALLRVEDDGSGLREGRSDSYGLEIMRERASRIGAELSVGPRAEGGTVVDVVIGGGLQRPPSGGTNEGRAGAYDGAARR
jgi:signal transduction histidine kinase